MSSRDPRRPYRQHRPRRASTGAATGAIVRPARPSPQRAAKRQQAKRGGFGRSSRSRRHEDGVASLGEARAHRHVRREIDKPRPRPRPDSRQRARRKIRTTKPLLANRFGAGQPRLRLISTLVVIVLVLGAVLGKIGLMQGTGGDGLRAAAAEMWTRTRELPAQRGAIFDRDGDELALSVPAATIAVNPKQVLDAEGTMRVLGSLLRLPDERIAELTTKINKRDTGFVYIARQVNLQVGQQISALDLVGVSVIDEDRRIRPGGTVGRSVIGRTDIDGIGIAGLEMQYDDLLSGTPGQVTMEVAPGGRLIAGTEDVTQPAIPGSDLVTTIDRSVQYQAEQVLIQRVGETRAAGGQIVVMDTDTGDVLAMVSVDRDDRGVPVVSTGNFAAVGAYEPGSVGKVITMAGALEDGAVTPDRYYTVPWVHDCTLDPGGELHDAYQHDPMPMSVRDILVQSSNVGTIYVSNEIGYERLDHYIRAFGLGEATALHFPGESAGIVKPWEDWTGTERCTMAYGQGLASTPIQLAAAVNVIANDGAYVAPRLVNATVGPTGSLVELPPSASHQVVSPQTAARMQAIMRDAVCDPRGTARDARVPGLSVAGKTGTAYKALPDGGYTKQDGTHVYYSSFVGFLPAEDPQVTILIALDEPGTGFNSGAQSAAPAFQQLAPTMVHELGIVPAPGSTDCNGN
jgi:cell division protein FtsI (penicillin-binding protein 3)